MRLKKEWHEPHWRMHPILVCWQSLWGKNQDHVQSLTAWSKNRSVGPVLIWWHCNSCKCCISGHISIPKLWYIVSSKMVTMQKKIKSLVMYKCKWGDIPVFFGKWNSPEVMTFCVKQLVSCLHLSVTTNVETHFNYIQQHTFQDHYIKYILFFFFQDDFLVQSYV